MPCLQGCLCSPRDPLAFLACPTGPQAPQGGGPAGLQGPQAALSRESAVLFWLGQPHGLMPQPPALLACGARACCWGAVCLQSMPCAACEDAIAIRLLPLPALTCRVSCLPPNRRCTPSWSTS